MSWLIQNSRLNLSHVSCHAGGAQASNWSIICAIVIATIEITRRLSMILAVWSPLPNQQVELPRVSACVRRFGGSDVVTNVWTQIPESPLASRALRQPRYGQFGVKVRHCSGVLATVGSQLDPAS